MGDVLPSLEKGAESLDIFTWGSILETPLDRRIASSCNISRLGGTQGRTLTKTARRHEPPGATARPMGVIPK
jgi:hypothetical protein